MVHFKLFQLSTLIKWSSVPPFKTIHSDSLFMTHIVRRKWTKKKNERFQEKEKVIAFSLCL